MFYRDVLHTAPSKPIASMPLQWDHEIGIKKKTIYFACCAQQFLTITRAAMHLRPSVLIPAVSY